ncbi:hypothetical protein FJTKL_10812 [Diaporthe vaccinii]|uniref:Uncharacterized protein n=1 Tax=Diaporthe vaccinii TaxID=105482 RepID=A0ABR4FBU7_9PEZI
MRESDRPTDTPALHCTAPHPGTGHRANLKGLDSLHSSPPPLGCATQSTPFEATSQLLPRTWTAFLTRLSIYRHLDTHAALPFLDRSEAAPNRRPLSTQVDHPFTSFGLCSQRIARPESSLTNLAHDEAHR